MRLLLVDGANVVMRAAWGGEHPIHQAMPAASAMLERAIKYVDPTHIVVALDCPGVPTWRAREYPAYKANRTTDTGPYLTAAAHDWREDGYHVEVVPGWEADDVLATVALRTLRVPVVVLSNDSDLLPLTAAGVVVLRPLSGGTFQPFNAADVVEKYRIPHASLLYDFKAMVGEPGDNVPGVPGIGAKKAAALLHKLGTLDDIIHAGKGGYSRESEIVAQHETTVRLALKLVSLNPDASVPPIAPSSCVLRSRAT